MPEQRFCKPLVGSSILSPGTSEIRHLADTAILIGLSVATALQQRGRSCRNPPPLERMPLRLKAGDVGTSFGGCAYGVWWWEPRRTPLARILGHGTTSIAAALRIVARPFRSGPPAQIELSRVIAE